MKLIVIDMQKALLVEQLYEVDRVIDNVAALIDAARSNGVEVVFVQHDAGAGTGFAQGDAGFEIAEKVAPKQGEKTFVKTINSAFGNADFAAYMAGEKDLMIVGLQTEFCVDATIKSAFERGYHIIVPKGTNSTFDNPFMKAEKAREYYEEWVWNNVFAKCVSMGKALEALKR